MKNIVGSGWAMVRRAFDIVWASQTGGQLPSEKQLQYTVYSKLMILERAAAQQIALDLLRKHRDVADPAERRRRVLAEFSAVEKADWQGWLAHTTTGDTQRDLEHALSRDVDNFLTRIEMQLKAALPPP